MFKIKKLLLEKDFTINDEWDVKFLSHKTHYIQFDVDYCVSMAIHLDGTKSYVLSYQDDILYNGLNETKLLKKIEKIRKSYC